MAIFLYNIIRKYIVRKECMQNFIKYFRLSEIRNAQENMSLCYCGL